MLAPLNRSCLGAAACGFLVVVVPTLVLRSLLMFGIGGWSTTGVPILLTMLALPAALLAGWHRLLVGPRARVTLFICGLLGLFVGGIFAQVAGAEIKLAAMARASRRAQPIIDAIGRYERELGHPPAHLRDLVPDYLVELPTGLPPLKIRVSNHYPPNEWKLEALTSSSMLNWDALLYLPHGNYEDFTWGGWIEPLGDWAYLHE